MKAFIKVFFRFATTFIMSIIGLLLLVLSVYGVGKLLSFIIDAEPIQLAILIMLGFISIGISVIAFYILPHVKK